MDGSEYTRVSGFVPQEDALFPFLAPQETLTYSALLRLKTERKEEAAKVKKLIQKLGPEHVAESRIGEGSRFGISGGERRRVSIGVELVHDPNVILIDEPTSGLDSASALQVVMLLKDMTVQQGKTIVLTIHQPGFRILELINRIVLLSNGVVVQNGSVDYKQIQSFILRFSRYINLHSVLVDHKHALCYTGLLASRSKKRARRVPLLLVGDLDCSSDVKLLCCMF